MTTLSSSDAMHSAPTSFHWTGKPVGFITWRGNPTYERASMGEEFYGNWHVFTMMDRLRVVIFVSFILFLTLKAHFVIGFSSGGSTGPDWLLRIPELTYYASAMMLLAGLYSLRRSKADFMYRIAEYLLNKWYGGNPPYIPCEMRAGKFQIVMIGINIFFFSLGMNLALYLSGVEVTTKDEAVAQLSSPVFNLWFSLFVSIRGYCPMRGWLAAAMGAGWIKAPPRQWAGMEMCDCSFAAAGPNLEYVGDKFYLQGSWTLKGQFKLVFKNYMTCPVSNLAMLLMWVSPFISMLLTWHKSEATMLILYSWFGLLAAWFGTLNSIMIMVTIVGQRRRMKELESMDNSLNQDTLAQRSDDTPQREVIIVDV